MQLFGNFNGGCGCTHKEDELNHGLKYVSFSSKSGDENHDVASPGIINLNIFRRPVVNTQEEAVKYDYKALLQTEFTLLAQHFAPICGIEANLCEQKLIAKFNKEMIKVAIYNPYCWKDVKYTAQALILAASDITAQYYYGVVKFEQVELTDVYGEGTTKTVSIPAAVADLNVVTPDVLVPNNKTMMKDLFVAVAQAMFPAANVMQVFGS